MTTSKDAPDITPNLAYQAFIDKAFIDVHKQCFVCGGELKIEKGTIRIDVKPAPGCSCEEVFA